MKQLLSSLSIILFLGLSTYAQESQDFNLQKLITSGGTNFRLVGDASAKTADVLFSNYPETKRKGYLWKFKEVIVPGIDKPITLQVHQGLYGQQNQSCKTEKPSNCCKGSYFNTFKNEKYKEMRLAEAKSNEQPALLIYVKRGKHLGLKNEKEIGLVEQYLKSLMG